MRIPFDESYTGLLGKAVYAFTYYEWTIIYIIEYLQSGFVQDYSRKTIMTSGKVSSYFSNLYVAGHEMETDIIKCQKDFAYLFERRNALIHAHPITAEDGAQILNYQTKSKSIYHDVQWTADAIKDFISEVDSAEWRAASLLDRLRPKNGNKTEVADETPIQTSKISSGCGKSGR